jgi:hypothetical protein
MERKSLSLQWMTKISPKLPSEFETTQTEFQHVVTGLSQRNTYSLTQITNADETADFLTCLTIILHISKRKTI